MQGFRHFRQACKHRSVIGGHAFFVCLNAHQDDIGIAQVGVIMTGSEQTLCYRLGDNAVQLRLDTADDGPAGIDGIHLPAGGRRIALDHDDFSRLI